MNALDGEIVFSRIARLVTEASGVAAVSIFIVSKSSCTCRPRDALD